MQVLSVQGVEQTQVVSLNCVVHLSNLAAMGEAIIQTPGRKMPRNPKRLREKSRAPTRMMFDQALVDWDLPGSLNRCENIWNTCQNNDNNPAHSRYHIPSYSIIFHPTPVILHHIPSVENKVARDYNYNCMALPAMVVLYPPSIGHQNIGVWHVCSPWSYEVSVRKDIYKTGGVCNKFTLFANICMCKR